MCPLITPSGSKISLSMRKQKGALTLRSLVPRTYRSLKKTTVLWAAKVAMVAAAMAANLATVVVVAVVTAADSLATAVVAVAATAVDSLVTAVDNLAMAVAVVATAKVLKVATAVVGVDTAKAREVTRMGEDKATVHPPELVDTVMGVVAVVAMVVEPVAVEPAVECHATKKTLYSSVA